MRRINPLLCLALVLVMMLMTVSAAEHPFLDVPAGSWYEPYVEYVYSNALMNGTSQTQFAPDRTMTRAMLVTGLYRMEDEPAVSGSHPFTDVPDSWYSDAVAWAYENAIVKGITATTFCPNNNVSREQMVTFFYRYAAYQKMDTSKRAQLGGYEDHASIASYAADPFSWAVAEGIINGTSSTQLSPVQTANRAQCATIIQRFTEKMAQSHHYTSEVVAPGCTEQGYTIYTCTDCGDSYTSDYTDPLGHTEVIDAGYPATDSEPGLTEGSHCGVCDEVLQAPLEIPVYVAVYSDSFYLEELAGRDNGEALRQLYQRLDQAATAFHLDGSLDATAIDRKKDGRYLAFEISFGDLGLSQEEATELWLAYKNDHPLYYWIDNTLLYSDTVLQVLTTEEYCRGKDRQSLNEQIMDWIQDFLSIVQNETSPYQIALAFHDRIILAVDYATKPDSNTPVDEPWAHNIVGAVSGRGVVCEGYAKLYQLLLKAAGVDCIYVQGASGTDPSYYICHAWNLVKLDDGQWYWVDLTADDTPYFELGVSHHYFAVTDDQNVSWVDGNYAGDTVFSDNHHAGTSAEGELVCSVRLPERATEKFDSDTQQLLRESFSVDDMTFAVNGYSTVQLVSIDYNEPEALYLPETVTYNGRTYTVNAIGGMNEDGLFGFVYDMYIMPDRFTSIHIPKTMQFIWDYALSGFSVEEIFVDPENPWFTTKDGVLYTASLYTLIQYPRNAPYVERFEIPEETVIIAYGAFRNGRNLFSELELGKNLYTIGRPNWGEGYPDAYQHVFFSNVVSGELSGMRKAVNRNPGGSLTIEVAEGSEYFIIADGLLYQTMVNFGDPFIAPDGSFNGTPKLVIAANEYITSATMLDTIQSIEGNSFAYCDQLTHITLPRECRSWWGALGVSESVVSIEYPGTVAQWNAFWPGKSERELRLYRQFWDDLPEGLCVTCTDGVIEKPLT